MNRILLTLISFLSLTSLWSQDIHFSQLHASPIYLNPAMTGVIANDVRFIANYKNQWLNTTANFNTISVSADAKLVQSNAVNLSMGMLFFSDVAGDLSYRKTNVQVPVAVLLKFNKRNKSNHLWSIGMQHGLFKQQADLSKVVAFESEPLVGELFSVNNMVYDLSLGTVWNTKLQGNHSFYFGYSHFHINSPEIQTATSNPAETLHQKRIIHGGGDFAFKNDKHAILPSFISMRQGPHKENTVGGFYRYQINDQSKPKAIYFGLWTRWYISKQFNSGFDAIIATVRYDVKNLSMSLAYDFTLSTLTMANKAFGGPELSLIYTVDVKSHSRPNKMVYCPKF